MVIVPDTPVIDPELIKTLLDDIMSDDHSCDLIYNNPELKALYLQFFPDDAELFSH